MNLSELDGLSVIVRSDAGETPAMTQMRAWTFLNALAASGSGSGSASASKDTDAETEAHAMATARKRVCEQFLGCRYSSGATSAPASASAADSLTKDAAHCHKGHVRKH